MSPLTHTLGYPRIGEHREHKQALEGYWDGSLSRGELELRMAKVRQSNWQTQQEAGIEFPASNDFSLYDHILDTSCLVGAVPDRFGHSQGNIVPLDTYFAMARGESPESLQQGTASACSQVIAQRMRKFLDTNYHYLVPEFRPGQQFALSSMKPLNEFEEALKLGVKTKPVLFGPVSYLQFGTSEGEPFDHLSLLLNLLPVYEDILARLNDLGAEWVQIDEPILVRNLTEEEREALKLAYITLSNAAWSTKLLLGTYFGDLRENLDLALSLRVNAIHLDATVGISDIERAVPRLHSDQSLSVGIVDGRKVWVNDLSRSLELLECLKSNLGSDRLLIAPSSSLQFVPLDVGGEQQMDPEIRSWLSFARQKLAEVVTLRDALSSSSVASGAVRENATLIDAMRTSSLRNNAEVQELLHAVQERGVGGRTAPEERQKLQAGALGLPPLPTTTIGSFPQTADIRSARARYKKGSLSPAEYRALMEKSIAETIACQEEAGVDVLVHGEPERNDMVQYFAEQLDGVVCTENGWVQSYGSRYVRPPIIYGDVSRSQPMTVEWAQYAQSRTQKLVKGMLTGPVTIQKWSYARDDIPLEESCMQIALAIRDELLDLERAGVRIIQVDEPAFREGLPLRMEDRPKYLRWASDAFRLAVSSVRPETQIHTHMCYAEFEDIVEALRGLDIDVISLEAARSRMAFLQSFDAQHQPFAMGPGVWDVHSPRVPTVDEFVDLINIARQSVPVERLWINPDCGLKTRRWKEVLPALKRMVEAAKIVRDSSV